MKYTQGTRVQVITNNTPDKYRGIIGTVVSFYPTGSFRPVTSGSNGSFTVSAYYVDADGYTVNFDSDNYFDPDYFDIFFPESDLFSLDAPKPAVHICTTFAEYKGFNDSFNYCVECDAKKTV